MNPFTLTYDPRYFCNRKKEISCLRNNALNGLNTLVHSPRRLGKTALILQLFNLLEKEKKTETLFIDLFATQNLNDLIRVFGESLLKKYHKRNLVAGVKRLFKGLYASITFSPDGSPQLNLGLSNSQQENSLYQLFDYIEKRKKPVLIAFDEFQEISSYPEKAEAVLRTYIQQTKNTNFIFSGSSGHILQSMFFSARQPFYQSTESLIVDKIDTKEYIAFIKHCFEEYNKTITDEAVAYLLEFSDVHTYYTQVVCNQAFYKTDKKLERPVSIEICKNYIENRKQDYYNILNLLPDNQKKLVLAVAKEGEVLQPTAVDFLMKYKLPSSSSVAQALNALEDKEIVYKSGKAYKVYDVFFRRFLEMYY